MAGAVRTEATPKVAAGIAAAAICISSALAEAKEEHTQRLREERAKSIADQEAALVQAQAKHASALAEAKVHADALAGVSTESTTAMFVCFPRVFILKNSAVKNPYNVGTML